MAQRNAPAGTPSVHLDPARGEYYYYDSSTNTFVYQSGLRIPRALHQERRGLSNTSAGDVAANQAQLAHARNQSDDRGSSYTARSNVRRPESPYGGRTGSSGPGRAGSSRGPQPSASSPGGSVEEVTGYFRAMNVTSSAGSSQERTAPGTTTTTGPTTDDGLDIRTALDERTRIRSTFAYGPPDRITDPTLFGLGIRARRMLVPTPEDAERFQATFRIHHREFFHTGRVFYVLWVEPLGETSTQISAREGVDDSAITDKRYEGELVYSKIRRFVVIREGETYCSALPIVTYGQEGVGKHGVTKSEHAIIHTSPQAPKPLPTELPGRNEDPMRSQAIRVVGESPTDKLDTLSRIDLGKVFTIQHNIKVKPMGTVHPSSLDALITQFSNVFNDTTGRIRSALTDGVSATRRQPADPRRQSATSRGNIASTRSSGLTRGSAQGVSAARPCTNDQDDGGGRSAGDSATPRPAEAQRTEAMQTYEAYRRLVTGPQAYRTEHALELIVDTLRRQQPRLSRSDARQRIISSWEYIGVSPQAPAPVEEEDDEEDEDGEDGE